MFLSHDLLEAHSQPTETTWTKYKTSGKVNGWGDPFYIDYYIYTRFKLFIS